MRGFLRSKLTQTLAALLMIAVAIIVPLSGNILYSHAAPSSSQASWNIVPSPYPGTRYNFLNSVSAISISDAWTVGYYSSAESTKENLTEHWNGSSWNVVVSPNVGTDYNGLNGVSAVSSSDVWAVGDYVDSSGTQLALTLHWDGSVGALLPIQASPIASS